MKNIIYTIITLGLIINIISTEETKEHQLTEEEQKAKNEKDFDDKIKNAIKKIGIPTNSTKITKKQLRQVFHLLFGHLDDEEEKKDTNKTEEETPGQTSFLDTIFDKVMSNVEEDEVDLANIVQYLDPTKLIGALRDFFSGLGGGQGQAFDDLFTAMLPSFGSLLSSFTSSGNDDKSKDKKKEKVNIEPVKEIEGVDDL